MSNKNCTQSLLHPCLLPLDEDLQGVQGSVFRCVLYPDHKSSLCVIAKISNHVDFVLELEQEVWRRLSLLASPHFCKVLGLFPIKKGSSQHCILYEAIRNHPESGKSTQGASRLFKQLTNPTQDGQSEALASFFHDHERHPSAVLNCVRQALAAIVLFESVGITHYDLHTDNIMVASANHDVHVYEFGDLIFPVFTFGVTPVIIDFGIAHVNNFGWAATGAFIKSGHTTFVSDPHVDLRLLLCTVALDLFPHSTWTKYKKEIVVLKHLRRNIKTMFSSLQIDKNGWFKQNHFLDIIKSLSNQMPDIKSGIFRKSNLQWILELLQFSIQLPIQKKEQTGQTKTLSFKTKLLSFGVLWTETVAPFIRNTHEEKLFFKDIVLSVVRTRSQNNALMSELTRLKHRYPTIGNIFRLKNAVEDLSNAMNNIIYNFSLIVKEKKQELYSNLVTKTALDAFCSFPSVPYRYETNMNILVQTVRQTSETNATSPVVGSQNESFSFTLTKETAKTLNADPTAIKSVVDSFRYLQKPTQNSP